MAQSMFQRYGGFSVIRQVVGAFYDRVLASPPLARYFENVAMERLIDHQTKFVATLMDGPASFNDDHIRRVHAHLGINRAELEVAADLLHETLLDFGVEVDDAAEVRRRILGYATLIVHASTEAAK
ncbi:MAG: group 1 truncated hemoglobin [Alphaproteobacteria bacterium]|nr:group 1 truncated hemoglobin [Alphaproteobacteria bacterium]